MPPDVTSGVRWLLKILGSEMASPDKIIRRNTTDITREGLDVLWQAIDNECHV
jgi:hypothetical protein